MSDHTIAAVHSIRTNRKSIHANELPGAKKSKISIERKKNQRNKNDTILTKGL